MAIEEHQQHTVAEEHDGRVGHHTRHVRRHARVQALATLEDEAPSRTCLSRRANVVQAANSTTTAVDFDEYVNQRTNPSGN